MSESETVSLTLNTPWFSLAFQWTIQKQCKSLGGHREEAQPELLYGDDHCRRSLWLLNVSR